MVAELQVKPERYFPSAQPGSVPIAPARPDHRRFEYKSCQPYSGPQATSIAKRNARERNRVKQVNDGFSALRRRLPPAVVAALAGSARRGSGKKLSKVDTLRMVVEYIRYLENLVEDPSTESPSKEVRKFCPEEDEGVCERLSPYTESLPSPVYSECSSGVSVGHPASEAYQQSSTYSYEDVFDSFTWC